MFLNLKINKTWRLTWISSFIDENIKINVFSNFNVFLFWNTQKIVKYYEKSWCWIRSLIHFILFIFFKISPWNIHLIIGFIIQPVKHNENGRNPDERQNALLVWLSILPYLCLYSMLNRIVLLKTKILQKYNWNNTKIS